MTETLGRVDAGSLERSCSPGRDSIRLGVGADGMQPMQAYFSATGFEPHRHDTYGIGIPVALGGRALPFVADPVHDQTPASRHVAAILDDIDRPISDLARSDAAAYLADLLSRLSGARDRGPVLIDKAAIAAVRDYLDAHAGEQTTARTLEQVAGIDRFTIARQFRRAYGTSPVRYRTMRRLDSARAAIAAGTPLAQAAADAGFADQSHLTRQFKRAYGLTPARFARALVR